jgi:hypothetical protein
VRKGDDLTAFIVPNVMKNPEALTFRIPRGLFRPVSGKLYLYLYVVEIPSPWLQRQQASPDVGVDTESYI